MNPFQRLKDRWADSEKKYKDIKDFIENGIKLIPIAIGIIYLIGFIVTAIRLSEYQVPTIKLLDTQYITAGLPTSLLILITVLVILSAALINIESDYLKLPFRLLFYGIFLILLLLTIMFSKFYPPLLSYLFVGPSYLSSIGTRLYPQIGLISLLFPIILTEFALWLAIFLFRRGRQPTNEEFPRLYLKIKRGLDKINPVFGFIHIGYILPFIFIVIVASWISVLPSLYSAIPQAYGGGKPIPVKLFVDAQKFPKELLDESEGTSPGKTLCLNLIFRTSSEYILALPDDNENRAWVIDSDAIYAIVETSIINEINEEP
ncbi:MAG: hypothetical protein ACXADH_04955 [Candidatus Kariarchaeaceae archaeon]|jgi:hypothetical protein